MNDLQNTRDNHAELDRHVVDALAGLMKTAPAPAAHPMDEALLDSHRNSGSGRSRIVLAVAASAIVALGAGGLIFFQPRSDSGVSDRPGPTQANSLPATAPVGVGFHFETPTVVMDAASVEVITTERSWVPTADVVVSGDPGLPNEYGTLEVTWHDNDIEQRLYLYFKSDGVDWWVNEIGTYNGQPDGDWYEPIVEGEFFRSPLGTAFVGDVDLPNLRISDMTLEPFRRPALCDNPTDPIALLADYPVITSFAGGFGATFQMIDTATCTPLPVAPYQFDYTVDDPTIVRIDPAEPIDGYPDIKTRVGFTLLNEGFTTVRATARNAAGDVVSGATMDITVQPAPVPGTPVDTVAPPATIAPGAQDQRIQSDFEADLDQRMGMLTERIDTLDYVVTGAQVPIDEPSGLTITLGSTIDDRTIVITMASGTMLQPENHNRVPITIVQSDDFETRAQLASNSGWTFELVAKRTSASGPLPTTDELQEILYSLDP